MCTSCFKIACVQIFLPHFQRNMTSLNTQMGSLSESGSVLILPLLWSLSYLNRSWLALGVQCPKAFGPNLFWHLGTCAVYKTEASELIR